MNKDNDTTSSQMRTSVKRPKLSENSAVPEYDDICSPISMYNSKSCVHDILPPKCNLDSGRETILKNAEIATEMTDVGDVTTQVDNSIDQGYGSNQHYLDDECRSSQGQSQIMYSQLQWDQTALSSSPIDSELEDLLFHFGEFFKDQFTQEFGMFQERIYDMLETQQNHVRRIVYKCSPFPKQEQGNLTLKNTDLNTDQASKSDAHCEKDVGIRQTFTATETSSNDAKTEDVNNVFPSKRKYTLSCVQQLVMPIPVITSRPSVVCVGEKELLELISMSSSCSTLLAKPQFHAS